MSGFCCSIIITNWNGKSLLAQTLPTVISAVSADTKNTYEILLVDDYSTDDSIAFVKENFKEVAVVKTPKNLGFNGANNFGVLQSKYDIVMLLNNDMKLNDTSLSPLIEHFANPNLFGVSGAVFDWNNQFVYGNRGGAFAKGHFSFFEKPIDETSSVSLFVCGGAGMFDKKKYLALGGFDTLYNPFYYEEVDISYRALKCGWDIAYEPESFVYHRIQSTVSKKFKNFQVKYMSGRNNYLFVLRNIDDSRYMLQYLLFIPLFLIRDMFKLKFRFWFCFFGALLRIPQIIKRKISDDKKCYKRTDSEIFNMVASGK